MALRRFWFEFEFLSRAPLPLGTWKGCGVTAWDRNDAEQLLCEIVFAGSPLPKIRRLIEDVDVSTLDPGHVLPNMGNVFPRGIWFPLGYAG
jgi:hypothetical protein